MTCEKAFDLYLGLDKDERVPLSVTIHLLFCPTCRTAVRNLTRAERALAKNLSPAATYSVDPVSDPALRAALARISSEGLSYPSVCPAEHRVSLYRWVICGLVMIAGFAIVPSSPIGDWTGTTFGNSYLVPFYLLCGVATTIYCGLFVGTNIDLFVKKFGFHSAV
jgi:hypothetical protein